jgi:hypothetical protein
MNVHSADRQVRMKSTAFRAAHPGFFRLALCTLPFALFPPSCARPAPEFHGRGGDILVVPRGNRVEADLGPAVSVQTARAAAEVALRSRGYVITESFGTRDRIKIQASGTGDRRTDTTTVEAWLSGAAATGTRLSVDAGFFGNSAAARVILDEIIARLGR